VVTDAAGRPPIEQDALMARDGQEEILEFQRLQKGLVAPLGEPGQPGPGVVVVLPSFTLDAAGMRKIPGVLHYEERLLAFLHLLRNPRRRIVYLSSLTLPELVVDYALGLVSSLPAWHARPRLTFLSCDDASPEPLTEKMLRRPEMVERIRQLVAGGDASILAFNGSRFERTLAVQVGAPLYACDPELAHLGSKSGARRLFREAGVPVPPGVEGLRDLDDVVKALTELRAADPAIGRGIVKLNESFGAGGNLLFDFTGAPPTGDGLGTWVRDRFWERIEFATPPDTWENYAGKLAQMGGVVEQFMDGAQVRSPSVQVRMGPAGEAAVLSTQDQTFVGSALQTYAGATFPAHPAYCQMLHELALRAGRSLAAQGAVGIASMDFLAVCEGGNWHLYALEINLRMGGGTAPLMFLDGLTGGRYQPDVGGYVTPDGRRQCFVSSDRLQHEAYRALGPDGVLEVAYREGLLYDSRDRRGAVLHMLGAVAGFGKMGAVMIDGTVESAKEQYSRLVAALDAASGANRTPATS
jgi:hypothetical protein